MKPKLARILAMAVALGALTLATDTSWSKGGGHGAWRRPWWPGGESPTTRLDAMNNRLDAMVQAVKTLRPTLGTFYASLSDEQKAQFNSMGQQNATPQENATGGRQQ